MRLVIISNMAHYRRADGAIVGHGATARELGMLATLFDDVRHVACLHDEPPPASALPYSAPNIELVPVSPTGGLTMTAKLGIARVAPLYARTIARELRDADAVHVRCPANISLIALAVLATRKHPAKRWIKYAGNWRPTDVDYKAYALQRSWLDIGWARAQVTINGSWPGQPAHVHTWPNPCLSDDDLHRGRAAAARKVLAPPIRLLFVGHLGAAKSPRTAIAALALLRARGVDAQLDLAGAGRELDALRREVAQRGLAEHVHLHGPLPRSALDKLYDEAHFIVLPTLTEGWPKVLSEGMASGAIPIASAVGSIPGLLARYEVGRAIELPPTAEAYASAIAAYVDEPERWRAEVERSLFAAREYSYAAYLDAVRALLELP